MNTTTEKVNQKISSLQSRVSQLPKGGDLTKLRDELINIERELLSFLTMLDHCLEEPEQEVFLNKPLGEGG